MDDIIERIKLLRKTIGKSQNEFAQDLNLKRNSITQIETGRRNPSERTLSDICRVYNVNKDWLISGSGGIENMFVPEDNMTQYQDLGKSDTGINEFKKFYLKTMLNLPDEYWDYIYKEFKSFLKEKDLP